MHQQQTDPIGAAIDTEGAALGQHLANQGDPTTRYLMNRCVALNMQTTMLGQQVEQLQAEVERLQRLVNAPAAPGAGMPPEG